MAIGVLRNLTKVAIKEESTEGTAAAPAAGTEFIQVLEGITNDPAKELVDRAIITPVKGKIKPRVSTKSASGSIPVEWKASGTEGADDLETHILYKSLLGGRRQITSRITTGTGHTTTNLNITGHSLAIGDFIVILEAGAHHMAFVTAVPDANNVTYAPAADSAPSDAVEIAESTTYYADANEPSFTLNIYWGDEILDQAIGARCSSLSLENIVTGQTPTSNFSFESLSFNQTNASAAFTPSFNDGLPPLALDAKVFRGTDCLDMNELSLSVENTLSFLTSVKNADGREAGRISQRAVNGTLTPYMDDTSVAEFTDFVNNSDFSVFAALAVPSSTAGELELGSCVAFYCPQATFTSLTFGDQDGTLTRVGEFQAHTGETGDLTELYMGFC